MGLTEEQRNCPYCHVVSDRPCYPIFDGYSINDVTGKKKRKLLFSKTLNYQFLYHAQDTNYETEYDNSTPVMNYCPMCGRPLSNKAEIYEAEGIINED